MKYNKVPKQVYEGVTFDSKLEVQRYKELRTLENLGLISSLKYHEVFPLVVNDEKICTYELDFSYLRLTDHKAVACEVKGFATAVFRLKWKLFKALYSNEFDEFEIWPTPAKWRCKRKTKRNRNV